MNKIIKILRLIKALTIGKLDVFLFGGEKKWTFIQPWMLNPLLHAFLSMCGFREGEHQIGRLRNLKRIFQRIKEEGLQGDVVEFGCYQGFGLFWMAKFRDMFDIQSMNIVGIDSFEGLPETSTIWVKGQFNDTSVEGCLARLSRLCHVAAVEEKNIYLIKGLFGEPHVADQLTTIVRSLLVAHVDCDLGSSCDSALSVLSPMVKERDYFLLFDDWYLHEEEIPRSFNSFRNSEPRNRVFDCIGRTRWTRYYYVTMHA